MTRAKHGCATAQVVLLAALSLGAASGVCCAPAEYAFTSSSVRAWQARSERPDVVGTQAAEKRLGDASEAALQAKVSRAFLHKLDSFKPQRRGLRLGDRQVGQQFFGVTQIGIA